MQKSKNSAKSICDIISLQFNLYSMHSWNLTPGEAIELQRSLAGKICIGGLPGKIQLIAGIDLAFDKRRNLGFCAIVIFNYNNLKPVEKKCLHDTIDCPYVPGLLSFREGPLFLKTFKLLENKPDLMIFDGQGIAHPRKMGIASHLGFI